MGLIPPTEYLDFEWFDTSTPLTEAELKTAHSEPTRRREEVLPPLPWAVASPPHGLTRTYGRTSNRNVRSKSAESNPTPISSTTKQNTRRRRSSSTRPSKTSR